jgi:hypothetical protein
MASWRAQAGMQQEIGRITPVLVRRPDERYGQIVVSRRREKNNLFDQIRTSIAEGLSCRHDHAMFVYAFDVVELAGEYLRPLSIEDRKTKLARLIKLPRKQGIVLIEHLERDGPRIFRKACRIGLEGLVSKRKCSRYGSGRSLECGARWGFSALVAIDPVRDCGRVPLAWPLLPGCQTAGLSCADHRQRHPEASIAALVLGLRCSRSCGNAPMPRLLGLHALPPFG